MWTGFESAAGGVAQRGRKVRDCEGARIETADLSRKWKFVGDCRQEQREEWRERE